MAEISFSANRNQIQAGECVTLYWRVAGVKAVYLFAEGEHWQEHGVVGEGQREVCPSQTTTYKLRVVMDDNSVQMREIPINVQGTAGQQVIQEFTVDKPEIRKGECAHFRWHVEGVKEVYFHREDNPWKEHGVAGIAETKRCPSGTSTFCLRVVKLDNSVETRCITVKVKS